MRGRPPGVSLHKRRAIEAAILEALPITRWDEGQPRPDRAFPLGWERVNRERVVTDVIRMFAQLGEAVSKRTVERAFGFEGAFGPGQIPADDRLHDDDLRSSAYIRHAADMLNLHGNEHRNSLIDALYAWCRAEGAAGRSLPPSALTLAIAFRTARAEKSATK
jgi:hypothetical protein